MDSFREGGLKVDWFIIASNTIYLQNLLSDIVW